MTLHHNQILFRQSIQFTSDVMNIAAIYVEKDYWVTFALHTIFNNEIGEEAIFKGGTALSKCYKMIDRFSEDIDLVVKRRDGETDGKLKAKLKAIGKVVATTLPEIKVDSITKKMGMNRKTAHSYNKVFDGTYGQIRDFLVLESTWLGYFEPYTKRMMDSFVGNMMIKNGAENLAIEYGLMPFEVCVLEPIRTLCEKIMSLVRFSYCEVPLADLQNKIRHTYDLHQLLQQQEFLDFFNSTAFDDMLLKVGKDDVVSFRNNNSWLVYHPKEAIVFKELENVWKVLAPIYNGAFKNLVYGNFPKDTAVLKTLKMIKERIGIIDWNIKIENKA